MTWVAVAKKEYLENVRNAWVVTVATAFLLLTVLASFVAAAFDGPPASAREAFGNIVLTFNIMQTASGFLLPILALLLGFSTIAGERESGSLALLTAQPISRGQLVAGKWVGLFGVLATAILVGFGLGGLFVLGRTDGGAVGLAALGAFVVETLAWGAAWVSIALLLSAIFDRRGTAIAGSIGAWFISTMFVWNVMTFLLLVVTDRSGVEALLAADTPDAPAGLILTQLLNPNAAYVGLLATTIDGFSSINASIGLAALPELYTFGVFAVAMLAWIVVPSFGAYLLFRRKDV